MQLKSLIIAVLTLGATLPGANAVRAVWNDKLKLWDIGRIPGRVNDKQTPLNGMGDCGPVKERDWACGRFGPGMDVDLRVIYYCNNGRLQRVQTCKRDSVNNMCVRNSRRKNKVFYPFVNPDNVVCVKRKDALK